MKLGKDLAATTETLLWLHNFQNLCSC